MVRLCVATIQCLVWLFFLGGYSFAAGQSWVRDFRDLRTRANSGAADVPASANAQTRIELDEDIWFRKDRDYSFGFRVVRRYNDARCYTTDTSFGTFALFPDVDPSRSQSGKRCTGAGQLDRHFEWYMGQHIYTASDVSIPPRVIMASRNERPYAGWLYLGVAKEVVAYDETYWRYGIDIGCTGPCSQAQRLQEVFHDLLGGRQPAAWDTQIRSQLGVILHYEVIPFNWRSNDALADWSLGAKGNLGNIFTDLGVTTTARLGLLRPKYGRYRSGNSEEEAFHHPKEAYIFIRFDSKYVAYNALLQGHMFGDGSPYTVNPKRVSYEGEAGLRARSKGYEFSLSFITRPNEVDAPYRRFRHHEFGRVSVTIPF